MIIYPAKLLSYKLPPAAKMIYIYMLLNPKKKNITKYLRRDLGMIDATISNAKNALEEQGLLHKSREAVAAIEGPCLYMPESVFYSYEKTSTLKLTYSLLYTAKWHNLPLSSIVKNSGVHHYYLYRMTDKLIECGMLQISQSETDDPEGILRQRKPLIIRML